MSSHTYHADIHTHGLQDDCPRCAELAEAPGRLMDSEMTENLRALIFRMMEGKDAPRSDAEATAVRNYWNAVMAGDSRYAI